MKNQLNNDEIQQQQKRALEKIWALKNEIAVLKERTQTEAVAVVGMGCRFPGNIQTLDDYWNALKYSRDCISEIPSDRWNVDAYYHRDPAIPGTMYVREGGFLQNIDQFDAEFFNLSMREAMGLDPQQRLLLEVTWEALANANIEPQQLSGTHTGVFLGVCTQDYARYSLYSNRPETIDIYSFTGNAPSIASGRLANILDLQGPAITFDTACSSSLVALHMAVQSLRAGETTMALVGGVNVILSPENFIYFCKVNALSPDARCKTFDESANGYVRSEGCGVVALKLLSTAQADGDDIHAIIRGCALNQDGKSYGLTAPNGSAQRALIKQALKDAGVEPEQVSFVETHGTGTSLGDPIEVGALAEIYGRGRTPQQPMLLGAVKSNIGHTEAAAGMAGFIKTVLCLKHGAIPSNLHFKQPNSKINWKAMAVSVSDRLQDWPAYAEKRIAGVSAFGFSGTNAHIIVEQAEKAPIQPKSPIPTKPPTPIEFHRKRCWLKSTTQQKTADNLSIGENNIEAEHGRDSFAVNQYLTPVCHPLLGRELYHCLSSQVGYESLIDINQLIYLRSHPVWGKTVMPGSGYVEMAICAAQKQMGALCVAIENLFYQEALIIQDKLDSATNTCQRLQLVLSATENNDITEFQICSLSETDDQGHLHWRRHATGSLRRLDEKPPQPLDRISVCARCQQHFTTESFYQRLNQAGYYYGSDHQGIQNAWLGEGEIVCQVSYPASLNYLPTDSAQTYFFHPAQLDACYQPLLMLLPSVAEHQMYVTLAKEQVLIYRRPTAQLWVHTRRRLDNVTDNTTVKADVIIYDEQGEVVAQTLGYVMARTDARGPKAGPDRLQQKPQSDYYRVQWQKLSDPLIAPVEEVLVQDETSLEQTGIEHTDIEHTLIYADSQGYGLELYAQLQAQGRPCILLHRGETVNRLAARRHYQFTATDAQGFAQVFDRMKKDRVRFEKLNRIIYCWGLDDNLPTGASMDIAPTGVMPLTHLLQYMIEHSLHCPLTVITRKAQDICANLIEKTEGNLPAPDLAETEYTEDIEPLQSTYWAILNVVGEEQPQLSLNCIDIDFGTQQSSRCTQLLQLLLKGTREPLLSLRGNDVYAPRLATVDEAIITREVSKHPLALKLKHYGDLSSLHWSPQPHRRLQAQEVEIAVKATGLNLRDVFDALGLHPRRLDEFGLECSGVVCAVGSAVSRVAVGDEVIAFGTGCFTQNCVVDEHRVAIKPADCDWGQAAAIPIAFLTAYYGLVHCAGLRAGNRVLIHAAAGGVGMAAVQIAQQLGAQVYATASTGKWETLAALGVEHIANSRNLTFVDDINRWTCDMGVDLVFNSLADDFIDKSVSLVSKGGCFIEIGLQGWSAQTMREKRPDIDYHIINLMAKWESDPGAVSAMLDDILAMFARGSLRPLPCEIYQQRQVIAAFRQLQQGKNIGKVVVYQDAESTGTQLADTDFSGTQVITGGLGAIGIKLAQYLVSQGCRKIALLARRPVNSESEKIIQDLRAQSVRIEVYQVDIASTELDMTLREIRRNMGAIKGVFHTAGVTDDKLIAEQNAESFARVFKPKVMGLYRLHRLTLTDDLDYFVLFSSLTSMLGSAGVANYAAANAFMNSFAQYRNRFGLRAVSLSWGPWAGSGMFQALPEQYRQYLQRRGLQPLTDQRNFEHLRKLITQSGAMGVFSIDWDKWLQTDINDKNTHHTMNPFFSTLKTTTNVVQPQEAKKQHIDADHSLQTLPLRQRRQKLIDLLQRQLADVLALDDVMSVDINSGFFDMGIDSLTSIEFRNRLQSRLNCSLPVTVFYDYPSVTSLVEFLLTHLCFGSARADTAPGQTGEDATPPSDNMTHSEAPAALDNAVLDKITGKSEQELIDELMR